MRSGHGHTKQRQKSRLKAHDAGGGTCMLRGGECLLDVLARTSNDYTHLEKLYHRLTGHELLSQEPIQFSDIFSLTATVVIPVHKDYNVLPFCLNSIANQSLTDEQFRRFDVIVVDDGSCVPEIDSLMAAVASPLQRRGIRFNFVRSQENLGRAMARNLALSIATGDVVIFLDADVVLDPHYLRETMVRHQCMDNVILVGFKQNVSIDTAHASEGIIVKTPNIEQDFRFSVHVKRDWSSLVPIQAEGVARCLGETDNFRAFGFGRYVGPFDLPRMIITHSLSAPRASVERVGRFHPAFGQLWGFEDCFIGACLIADGNYVIPLLSSGIFHIVKSSEQADHDKATKQGQIEHSFRIYATLLRHTPYHDVFQRA